MSILSRPVAWLIDAAMTEASLGLVAAPDRGRCVASLCDDGVLAARAVVAALAPQERTRGVTQAV